MNRTETFTAELDRRVNQSGNDLAVRFKNTPLSNMQLQAVLMQLRRELGPLHASRVVVLLPDCLAAYVFYLHLFLGKGVLVPVSPLLTGEKISDICRRASADLVVTNAFLFKAHEERFADLPCLIMGDWDPAAGPLQYELRGPAGFSNKSGPPEPVRMIIFTSGSTGVPKGVCLSENNILSAAEMMVDFLPLKPATTSLVTVPLYDYYGMIQIFGHILGGGKFIFGLNSAFPAAVFSGLQSSGCTDLVLVPHTLRTLLGVPRGTAALLQLQRVTSSSDLLSEELLQHLFEVNPDVVLINIYGLTEAGRAVYRRISKDTPFSHAVGIPSKDVTVEINGTKDTPGEIVIRGPNVMLGYLTGLKDERLQFNPCREMRTGDLGYFDENNEIVLLGRRDHMINLMGMKIHPHEIESAALRVDGVSDVRAIVDNDGSGGKTIRLEVVRSGENGAPTADGILHQMRSSLPRAFVPTKIDFVPAIRRTEIGAKILR